MVLEAKKSQIRRPASSGEDALPGLHMSVFLLFHHIATWKSRKEKERDIEQGRDSNLFPYKDNNSNIKAHPHVLITSQSLYDQIVSHGGLQFQYMNFGGR